jgi:DNA-binding transcriptional LysR family regulator
MAERYPEVTVEVVSDEALSDIVGEGFDAGLRLGEMIAADMVTVRLTPPFRAVVVGSPSYIGRHGRPVRPSDLTGHSCINYRLLRARSLYAWEMHEDGRDVAVEVTGTAVVTDSLSARSLALAGVGLAYLFEPLVAEDLAAGRLVEVLAPYAITEPGFFLYYPKRAALAPKLRAFIDTARSVKRR